MPRPSKEEVLRRVHDLAMLRFNHVQSTVYNMRQECLQDRRFATIAGAQWEDPLLGQRFANKPRMEINKIHRSVMRVMAEQRNNQLDVVFVSKDGTDDMGLAETCNGLYRADKQDSHGNEAFRNAFEEAVAGGFGAFRLYTEYEDEGDPENENQRICFEPITDADENVFFDLNSKRQDKSDAKFCFVMSGVDRQSYEDMWGPYTGDITDPTATGTSNSKTSSLASMPHSVEQRFFDWSTPDLIYVAEYYVIEENKKRVEIWADVLGNEQQYDADELEEPEEPSEGPGLRQTLVATGAKFVRARTVKTKQVHKYLMDGNIILEDVGIIAGPNIPIIPVYGMRWFIDGEERYMGRVRMAKDAQRLLNMQVSRLAEIAAISPIPKPVFAPEQVDEFRAEWEDDNLVNHPYLRVNAFKDKDGNPIALSQVATINPPDIPPAVVALTQYTETALQDLLGTRQDTQKIRSNISAEAVELVQADLDMDSYLFIDNGALAEQRAAEVWYGMAKELYIDDGRIMKTIGTQGQVGNVQLMRKNMGPSGEYLENDLRKAAMDVTTVIGPASQTRKDAIVRTMSQLLPAAQGTGNPNDVRMLLGMLVMNLQGDGIRDMQEYWRKQLVGMGAAKPTDEEAKAMAQSAANQQPSAQDQWALAAAQKEQALAQKAHADMLAVLADIGATKAKEGLTWAQAIQTAEGIDMAKRAQLLEMINMLDSGNVMGQ